MERGGFILTVLAGLLSCTLLGWQGYEGAKAGWISGFLCVMWSLLMFMRLMVLTAPHKGPSAHSHLAQKILRSFYMTQEMRRNDMLQKSFGTSFAVFLMLGFLLVLWQVFCAVFPANNYVLSGLTQGVQEFFATAGASPLMVEPVLFDWGQGFLFLLCLSMMGFLLRSYSSDIRSVRTTLLVLAGYVAAGWITFFGFSVEPAGNLPEPQIMGYGIQASMITQGGSLLDRMILESGILGLALMAFILFVPLGFIWLSLHFPKPDWVVIGSGTLAALALMGCVFLSLNPALGGFVFLCWMVLFLAWGASENQLAAIPA